jgi:hypothetical protein
MNVTYGEVETGYMGPGWVRGRMAGEAGVRGNCVVGHRHSSFGPIATTRAVIFSTEAAQ